MPRGEKRPSLYQRVTNTSRVDAWIQRRKETRERKKNRKVIDGYVQKVGQKGGGALSLDKDGVCCFPYRKFVIVIEVPEHNTNYCQFRTTVCPLGPKTNEKEVIRTVMALHNQDTKAIAKRAHDSSLTRLSVPMYIDDGAIATAVLDVVPDGVHMSWELPIKGLKFQDMAHCLDDFLGTTVDLNKKIELAKTTPKPVPMRPERRHESPLQMLKCL